MIRIRHENERGRGNYGWLNASYSFSFARYYNPEFMGFRSLRVLNEDQIAPGGGFPKHPHDNMEIITYVVDGAVRHGDSMGNEGVVSAGEIQRITAGSGIEHSEVNASDDEPLHLYQIWIEPTERDLDPAYDQRRIDDMTGGDDSMRLIASPDGAGGSMPINAAANIHAGYLDNESTTLDIGDGRGVWLQVIDGDMTVNGEQLSTSDGAAIDEESRVELATSTTARFLIFDVA